MRLVTIKGGRSVRWYTGEIVLVPTGVKAYMQPTEVLYLYDRSSNPRKKGLFYQLCGFIDGDYYGNSGNEGHILLR